MRKTGLLPSPEQPAVRIESMEAFINFSLFNQQACLPLHEPSLDTAQGLAERTQPNEDLSFAAVNGRPRRRN